MNPVVRRDVFLGALLATSLAALGFIVGHRTATMSAPTGATQPAIDAESRPPKQPASAMRGAARSTSASVPVDLKNLNGKEFVDALPALEALARHGDLDAVHLLIQRLGSCGDFHALSDEEIRSREDTVYQRNIDAAKSLRSSRADNSMDPRFSDEAIRRTHETALRAAFDERDLCTSLTVRQIDGRFDWVRLALDLHDRQTTIDMATTGGGIGSGGAERVRNAEKLIEIARMESNNLNDLIATGDTAALKDGAVAYGKGWNMILQRDPELAYAYAYAWTLAEPATNTWEQRQIAELMEQLTSGQGSYAPLSQMQIDDARKRGIELFQRCCSAGAH